MTPEPVYLTPRVSLYFGNAADMSKLLPPRSIHLLLTDPPYLTDAHRSNRTDTPVEMMGNTTADRCAIQQALRIGLRALGPHRHAYLFGPADVVDDLPLSAPTEIIWDKGAIGLGNLSSPWGPQYERLWFCTNAAHHRAEQGTETAPVRMRKGTVLRHTRRTGKGYHPAEKPVSLLADLIESSSRFGDVVYDPFCGSGSTLVAAILEGRKAIGVESDERYIGPIVERLAWAGQLADARDKEIH